MNFGQNILKKYGWKEGDGLGKNSDGIAAPIKATRKTNLLGLGSSTSSDITGNNWWERVFNEASNNLSVEKTANGDINVSKKDEDGVEITNKSYSMKKLKEKSNDTTYGGKFLKAATLLGDVGKEKEIADHVKTEDIQVAQVKSLSDAELFAACGGLTAHKGARHGLKLTGKLNRLAEQDDQLLTKLKQRTQPVQEGIFRELNGTETDLKTPEWQNAKEKLRKPKFLISSVDDHPNVPQDELIEVLNVANYSRKSKKAKKRDRKVESELIEKLESAFGTSLVDLPAEDSDGDVVCDEKSRKSSKESKLKKVSDESKVIQKKKKRKKNQEHLVEKALEMIDSGNEHEAHESKSSRKKKNKKNRKQQNEIPEELTPVIKKSVPVKIKRDSGSESSANEEDVVDRINEEMHHLSKKRRIERSEEITTEFQQEHKRKCKKFKNDDQDDWSTGKKKKMSKSQKRAEKKLCKQLEKTI